MSENIHRVTARPNARLCAVTLAVMAALSASAAAQTGGPGSSQGSGASSGSAIQQVQGIQQQLSQPGPSVTPTQGSNDPSYKGSIVRDKATQDVLALTIDDAIQRGLKNNLGLVLQSSSQKQASGERLQQLQQLLPTVTAAATYTVEQVNLAAYGLKFPGINPIIGPFQVFDFRAYLTQNLINVQSINNYVAAKHNFEAAKLTAQDARDLVVLSVGNAYLLCIADQARINAVQAELQTAELSAKQARDNHAAGTAPRIDVLRTQVDVQTQQQQLISTTNSLEKDKLALARVIGLPLDQKFTLSDSAPYKTLETPDPNAAFQSALAARKDLAASAEKLKAAESAKKAAVTEQLPALSFSGDYGDLGTTPAHSHGTFTAQGTLSTPVLQIAKMHGDQDVAQAQLDQAKASYSDQVQQVNADVRDAILDIQSSAKLVDAAQSNVELAREALSEAQQRFHVGVADSLPVSQAQTQFQQANDQYISALYQHNIAKLALARALGVAATNSQDYLGGK
ncbi:TolC family protein [Granulicella cerasi]|uniref:TolC family protein n=1 Tax=Granulicella cerasi TaxID=741063 RepID=A0ABW1ZDY5_9BACT|nr:TolC family protein [Granulicella cerasi]